MTRTKNPVLRYAKMREIPNELGNVARAKANLRLMVWYISLPPRIRATLPRDFARIVEAASWYSSPYVNIHT